METVRSRSVMIGTPAHHDVATVYAASLAGTVALLERLGIRQELRFILGQSNLPKARNEIVAEFLATDLSDLIMIDSDIREQHAGGCALRRRASFNARINPRRVGLAAGCQYRVARGRCGVDAEQSTADAPIARCLNGSIWSR